VVEFILIAGLLGLLLFYHRRERRLKNLLEDLTDSVENGRQLLLDSDRDLAVRMGVERLLDTIQVKMEERSRFIAQSASRLEQIQAMFRNMREGALVIDSANRIIISNLSADRLLNGGNSLVNRRVERFIHHPVFLDFVREVKQEGIHGRRQIETDLLGRAAWLEISGGSFEAGIAGEDDRLGLYLVNDITRLKKLEAIRRDFAANVSHELRTPITIIKGFAETLHEDGSKLSEEQRAAFVEKINRNAGRLHSLVEDLLSLSRLESRALDLKKESCDLRTEISEFAREYRTRSDDSKALRLELPPMSVEAEVDRVYFARILTNLVDNAFKHGETLTFVRIRLEMDSETGLIEMEVADDGAGIPEIARDRIFQRFYRVDTGRSRLTGGTGLGLSIVRHAMLAHGGNVRVERRIPKGARFICVFRGSSSKPEA